MGLNPESEILDPEAREPQVDAPSPGNQDAAAKKPVAGAATEPTEPGQAPQPKKPKRRYRTSDKVRASSPANLNQARKAYVFTPARKAASMKNLEKANAAPPEKRNRLTPLRLLARYANLCLANLKLGPPGQRSPTHIRYGTSCRHLEHSLALAGENKVELEAHRERFQRAFRPRDQEESRLVRGMADAAWRVLRAYGVRFRWEMRAVQFRLMVLIGRRQADPSEPKLRPEAARLLALQLLSDLGEIDRLYEERRRLLKRLEELFRAFLTHRMGEASALRFFTTEGSSLPDFEHLPDFALSNPSLWPGLAEKLAQQEAAGPRKLKETKDWKGQPKEGEEPPVSVPMIPRERPDQRFLHQQMLQSAAFKDDLDQAGLEQLLAMAFGIEPENRKSKVENREAGSPSPAADCPEGETGDSQPEASSGGRVSNFQFRFTGSQSSISEVAAVLWERLVLFRDWREREARELDEMLEQASGPRGVETWEPRPPAGPTPKSRSWPELEDESPHWQWRALAALLLAVFASDTTMLTQAAALADRLQEALYRFLIGHYRQAEGFERLQPRRQKAPPWSYPEEAGVVLLRARWANGVRAGVGLRV